MANEELGLRLTAQITEWLANLTKAGAAADGLKTTVLELEQAVKRAFAGIEAISRQSGGKMVGAFVGAAREMDKATDSIEADAKRTVTALGGVAVAADKTAKSVTKSADDLGKASADVGHGAAAAASNTTSALAGVDSAFGEISSRIKDGLFSIQTGLAALGAVKLGQESVGAASEFGQAVAYVGTVLDDTGVPLEKYRQQILDLGGSTSQNAVERAKTLYQILSSGIPATEGAAGAGAVLEISLKAATAGMANAEDAAKAITGSMNAYKESGLTAAAASDILFQTVNRGVVEFPELAQSLGQVSGIAASLGVSLPEVGAAIATITKAGVPASEAITSLKQTILSIAKPQEKAKKAFEDLGIEVGAAALEQKGLVGILQEVSDKTGGAAGAVTQLFTDSDALKSVLALLRGGMVDFKSDVEAMGESAGATDKAFNRLSAEFSFQADVAKNTLGAALIQIGEKILPTVTTAMGKFSDFAEKNGAAIAEGIGRAVEALAAFGGWVIDYGPTILTWFVALKGVAFFAGLERDIIAAAVALTTFTKGLAASRAIGQGMAALGGTAGTSFNTGVLGKLKGLGGMMRAVLGSGTFIAV
ncbi:MAG: hypothetical protein QG602_2599, partial [Verrucomicrobiota bacterium]|nr:hypothetical protein [Verrucomicrobiota bacterium]